MCIRGIASLSLAMTRVKVLAMTVCAWVIASNEVAKQSLGYVEGDCFAFARNDSGNIARNDNGVQVIASNGVAKQSLGYKKVKQ